MHLPSRGLRLSATTMRNAGVFFVPTRFMRIFTDICVSKERGDYQMRSRLQALNFEKIENPNWRIAPKVLLPGVGAKGAEKDSLCQKSGYRGRNG
jgi:hypothetical protein